jgi:hypothetical protein
MGRITFPRESKPFSVRRWIDYATIVVALIGGSLAFWVSDQSASVESLRRSRESEQAELNRARQLAAAESARRIEARQREIIAREVSRVRVELSELKAHVLSLGATGLGDPAIITAELNAVRDANTRSEGAISSLVERTSSIDARMKTLETVILTDPQKALAVPLLQRDLTASDARFHREIEVLQAENGRVYDLMKWIVGLMALVSLSLVGTAVGNVFRREPTGKHTQDEGASPRQSGPLKIDERT